MGFASKKLLLVILDGFGCAKHGPYNAISLAKPKNLYWMMENFGCCKLRADGPYVGLPIGQVGNSKVCVNLPNMASTAFAVLSRLLSLSME